MASTANTKKAHDRYKVEIFSQDSLVRTLGIPAHKSRFRIVEIARKELKTVPTATHVTIRALNGVQHDIFAADGWWKCQMKAFKL
ncbi:hypothetical protein ACR0ST_02015 [Aliidiomarina sp. Khilg15.8]